MKNVRWVIENEIASWDTDDGMQASGSINHPELAPWLATGNVPQSVIVPTPPTIDEIYDALLQQQRLLRAVVLALNDGTFPVGANRTAAQLKAIIKAKL